MPYATFKNSQFEQKESVNIQWSPKHFQTAESLSDAERAQFDLYLVVDSQPELTESQKWGESTYAISGTDVIRTWVAVDKTAEELAEDTTSLANSVRSERDVLIAATDFYALSDVVMTTEMTNYRQALRALPEQEGFPHTVVWPAAL